MTHATGSELRRKLTDEIVTEGDVQTAREYAQAYRSDESRVLYAMIKRFVNNEQE